MSDLNESLPQYYNYTNKGQTYQFDLSQLTPEERKRFMKLNERQKMKIITLMDLKDEGRMKNVHDLRPAYIDEDENKRENDLRTLTAKKEATEQLIKKMTEEGKKLTLTDEVIDEIQKDPDYALITKTDIDKILAVNPSATLDTLKKYYTELIKELRVEGESFRVKKAIMGHPLTAKAAQAKPELLKKLFSETNGLLGLLINNTQFLHPQPREVKLTAEEKVQKEEVQEAQKALAANIPKILEIDEKDLMKIIESPEKLKEMKNDIDNFIEGLSSVDTSEFNEGLPEPTYKMVRKRNKPVETGYEPVSFIKQKEYDDIQNILTDALNNTDPDEKLKKVNKLINGVAMQFGIDYINPDDIKGTYEAVRNISVNKPYAQNMFYDKSYYPKGTSNSNKEKITAFTSTMNALGDKNEEFRNIFNRFVNERIEKNTPYKSGSIWKIFHPNAQKFKDLEQSKSDISNLKEELEILKSQTKSEISNLREEIQILKEKSTSQAKNVTVSPLNPGNDFLKDIEKPRDLRRVSENKNESIPPAKEPPQNDLESDLRNAMLRRREDLEPDSEDEDSEEWGEGVARSGKIKLSDYLRKSREI